jgi:hypothetical protein
MHRVAARLRAGTPRVAPLQRSVDALWIGTLNGVAAEIARADAVRTEPDSARRTGKAALLRTTRLATDPGFPPPLRTLGEPPAAATL